MNKLNFNQTGGFPLSTNVLDAMQTAYSIFNSLGEMAGNFAIISGCDVSGNNVTDGVVYVNGEVLEFRGGSLGASVIIKEDVESRVFEDGSTKNVIAKRYATFGSSTPDKTYNWADFKRVFPTTQIKEKHDDFEARIKKLESAKFPIPVGMIAIWNKPASEPIPDGWRECTDLRGRVPLGWNPDDEDFAYIGTPVGEKAVTLNINEIPAHNHDVMEYAGIVQPGYSQQNHIAASVNGASSTKTGVTGGNQPHNNIQPSRIVRFIEYAG